MEDIALQLRAADGESAMTEHNALHLHKPLLIPPNFEIGTEHVSKDREIYGIQTFQALQKYTCMIDVSTGLN